MNGIIFFATLSGKPVTLSARHVSSYEEVTRFFFWTHIKIIMTNGTVYRIKDTYKHVSEVIDPILKAG